MDIFHALSDRVESSSWWLAVGVFLAVAAYESVTPEREHKLATLGRWMAHFALYGIGLVLVFEVAPERLSKLLFATEGPHFALALIDGVGGGLAVLILGCLAIDLLIYITHRLHHRFFVLWRFHAVHHADAEMDLTTTLRHHPAEFLANGLYVAICSTALGMPNWVFPFYAALSVTVGYFQHMNGRIPERLDRVLRWVIVTPAMHRAHHSVCSEHHNANYGSVFSLWDRLFGTHLVLAPAEQTSLTYGVPQGAGAGRFGGFGEAILLPLTMRNQASASPGPVYEPGD